MIKPNLLQIHDEIYPIPELPPKIKSAVSDGKLVIFIGAGASRIIGCLGWKELAEYFIDLSCEKKLINHWEQERLKTNDPRKTISILKTVMGQADYEKALDESLKAKDDLLEKFPIYKHLIKLRSTYITTNIDTYFDSFFEPSRIYIEPSQFKGNDVKQNTLFKLHGSITEHRTVIFTTQDYILHYNKPEVNNFLKGVFNSDYTVLFIGYSLAELEILDYVLLKGDKKLQDSTLKEAKHFLLLPFYGSEKGLLRFERSYFGTLNVLTIPYAIDDRGHKQLHYVIEAWEREINISTPYLFKSYRFIEDNVDDYIDSNASEILQLIKNDNHFRDHFFKNLITVKWFNPLKEKGYFSPENATSPVPSGQEGFFTIPLWNVLPYLERVSQQVNVPDNEKYIDELLGIIREVTDYHIKHDKVLDNYHTWYYFIKILLNIQNDKIPPDIIDLIPIWLNTKFDTDLQGSEIATKLLPKFLTDNLDDIKKAEKIIDSITAIKTYPLSEERTRIFGRTEEAQLVIYSEWLEEAFKKHSEIIGEKCTTKVVEDLTKKIKSLLKNEEDETYFSFYDEREHHITEPIEMFTFILKRILLAKAKSDVSTSKEILQTFLKDKYLYFPKMAIYVMGQNMDKYSELFWEVLDTETGGIIMEKTFYLGDELKHLLENLKNLTEEQREKLNTKIENAAKQQTTKEDPEKSVAIHKQRIYEALSHDPYFKNLYEEMKKISGWDVALHSAVGKVETRVGPGPSPLTKDEIIKMSNGKLADFLVTFKTKDSWRGPTVGGLAGVISEAAKDMPEKFIDDFEPFKDTGFTYIYEILSGTRNAWNEKKDKNWNELWSEVFKFIKPYIDRKEFWEDKFIVEKDGWLGEANHQWVAGIVADLIQDGTRDDAWAFHEQCFEKAEEIVFLLLDNLKTEDNRNVTDYVTYTLNTSLGRTTTALILLAFRIARVNSKKSKVSDVKWKSEFKNKYEEILDKKMMEGFVNLGYYMPNLYYLDKEWVKGKIKSLENEKGSKYWEAFIDGYLSIGEVYNEFYDLMRTHYEYGLIYDFKERHIKEHLIQHICIGYLRGQENIGDSNSLFRKIIDAWKPEQIKEVINYFRMQRDFLRVSSDENEKRKEKIIEFWKLLYEKYNKKDESSLTKDDRQILSAVSELAVFLPQINAEYYEWLMLSAHYVHEDFKSSFFVKRLDGLKDKGDRNESSKYIGEIYLKMLEKGTPDYDQKHIRSIVEFLYNAGATDSAGKICNIYGSRGQEFLRDIYEKHSNRT